MGPARIADLPDLDQQHLDQTLAENADITAGEPASYTPELMAVDPAGFGLTVLTSDGCVYESGDTASPFTIQLVSKPFTYAFALDQLGTAADHPVVQRTLSAMVTWCVYDAAGDWVSAVGMPAKSGLGGGISPRHCPASSGSVSTRRC